MFYLERDGAVATLRHIHPPQGLLTGQALAQLRRTWRTLEQDPTVRVIVLRGTIVHTELDEIDAMLRDAARIPRLLIPLALLLLRAAAFVLRRLPGLADLLPPSLTPLHVLLGFDAIQRSSKITIAVIEGACVGGGLELSLCFDYRLATPGAGPIGCPEVRMGLLPGFGGSQRLARLVGAARARELLLGGDLLSATEAHQAGIVSRLIQHHDVPQLAADLARRPPLAVAAIKRALADDVWSSLWRELREVMRVARTRDVARGLAGYRAALVETQELPQLLARMEELPFEGA